MRGLPPGAKLSVTLAQETQDPLRFQRMLAVQIRHAEQWIPPPQISYRFVPRRKLELDLAWVPFMFGVEVQGGIWRRGGGAHSRPKNIMRDVEKVQLALLGGWTILPVTTLDVQRGRALELVVAVLKLRGYSP